MTAPVLHPLLLCYTQAFAHVRSTDLQEQPSSTQSRDGLELLGSHELLWHYLDLYFAQIGKVGQALSFLMGSNS